MVFPEPEVDWALETEARPVAKARNARLLNEEDMMIGFGCSDEFPVKCKLCEERKEGVGLKMEHAGVYISSIPR